MRNLGHLSTGSGKSYGTATRILTQYGEGSALQLVTNQLQLRYTLLLDLLALPLSHYTSQTYNILVSKDTNGAREFLVALPKVAFKGSHFGSCTCGVPAKEGVP